MNEEGYFVKWTCSVQPAYVDINGNLYPVEEAVCTTQEQVDAICKRLYGYLTGNFNVPTCRVDEGTLFIGEPVTKESISPAILEQIGE